MFAGVFIFCSQTFDEPSDVAVYVWKCQRAGVDLLHRKGTEMSDKKALIIKADFAVEETGTALKELQTAVDGYIEAIDLSPDLTMWVNEEYLLRNELIINPLASALFASIGGNQPVFGDVVFTGGTDPEGYTLGLTEKDLADLKDLAVNVKVLFEQL